MGARMTDIAHGAKPGELIARHGSRVERLYAVSAAGTTWVFRGGYVYEIKEEAPGRKRAGAHESLTAPMPATVIQVNVSRGAEVKRGDILILLEAMKMELPLRAPADGQVEAIHCRAGELVQPGATLIELA